MTTRTAGHHLAIAAAQRAQRRHDRRYARELRRLRRALVAQRISLSIRLLHTRVRIAAASLRRDLESFFRGTR